MDLKNIETIMASDLWKRMIGHRCYKGYYIVHPSNREASNKNVWCALWVFFDWKIADATIKKYHKEGASMCKDEMLDHHELPIECYGKVLVFS